MSDIEKKIASEMNAAIDKIAEANKAGSAFLVEENAAKHSAAIAKETIDRGSTHSSAQYAVPYHLKGLGAQLTPEKPRP